MANPHRRQETAPSVATTPLSGYSAGISRSNKQLVQHQTLPTATPLVATKQGVFRPYSPAKARKCEEGLSKACLDCHFKKRTVGRARAWDSIHLKRTI